MQDLFVWKRTETLVLGHVDSWDEMFMRDLVIRLKGGGGEVGAKGARAPWRRDLCGEYHEHDGERKGGSVVER